MEPNGRKSTFTDKFIKSLQPEGKTKDYREAGSRKGFGIRVFPSGAKTFFYCYTVDGARRFLNLGHYKDANRKEPGISLSEAGARYLEAANQVKNGIDPLQEKVLARLERKRTPTVKEFIETYIEDYAKLNKRSWRTDEKVLSREIMPLWGKVKITDIQRRDINPILTAMIKRGSPIQANRLLAYVRKMFSFAVEQGVIDVNPFLRMKLPSTENACSRVLTTEEIKTFWEKLESSGIPDPLQRALKLILVTGQRPGEVIGMHSSEIDGHWWTLPVSRQKVHKTKEAKRSPHRVFLSNLALKLIGDRDGFIFPSPKKDGQAYDSLVMTKYLKTTLSSHFGIEPFTPHDLRRTAATFLAESGEMDEVIDAVLNHTKAGIVKVYNCYRYDKEKQSALEAWSRKLESLVTDDTAGKVLAFRKAKGE